ncbi:MAG: hypothetical protein JRM86_00280 [Nitrososphaerota archaeon]|nr:hypothetical protein [Nitrososphaerota archaeon]
MTASELGEHTSCPRAWWYGHQQALSQEGSAPDPREGAFARGLQVQTELQAAHLAPLESRGFPWGAFAAACFVLLGGFVLWTLWL